MEYIVVDASSDGELGIKVSERLNRGWKCVGGVAIYQSVLSSHANISFTK